MMASAGSSSDRTSDWIKALVLLKNPDHDYLERSVQLRHVRMRQTNRYLDGLSMLGNMRGERKRRICPTRTWQHTFPRLAYPGNQTPPPSRLAPLTSPSPQQS
jgi:hypothetical protein